MLHFLNSPKLRQLFFPRLLFLLNIKLKNIWSYIAIYKARHSFRDDSHRISESID